MPRKQFTSEQIITYSGSEVLLSQGQTVIERKKLEISDRPIIVGAEYVAWIQPGQETERT